MNRREGSHIEPTLNDIFHLITLLWFPLLFVGSFDPSDDIGIMPCLITVTDKRVGNELGRRLFFYFF